MEFWQGYVIVISSAALIWAMKEVHEMVTVRKMWQRALTDPEYAGQVVVNAVLGFLKNIDNNPEQKASFMEFIGDVGEKVFDVIRPTIEDPEYLSTAATATITGLLNNLKEDKELSNLFMEFMGVIGINMFHAAKATIEDQTGTLIDKLKPVKLPARHWAKPAEGILNEVIDSVRQDMKNEKTIKDVTEVDSCL